MEKTLQFTINEALESGRLSAMPQFLEMELREKIAQEIQAYKEEGDFQRGFPGTEEDVLDIAIKIARGTNV